MADTKPLSQFPSGARVRKPSASPFDFAFEREGTVYRDEGMIGVLFDGAWGIFQYSPDDRFAAAEPVRKAILQ